MLIREGYAAPSKLTISSVGSDLKPQSASELNLEQGDQTETLKQVFIAETKAHQLTIPRSRAIAVQLCSWRFKYVQKRST